MGFCFTDYQMISQKYFSIKSYNWFLFLFTESSNFPWGYQTLKYLVKSGWQASIGLLNVIIYYTNVFIFLN